MLPGFNHNIRYKDRVFHVQTEDNGLKQPRLITQVFIDGHVLALEKSTYDHILVEAKDDKVRDDLIRTKMQDQHKQLLKNLVQGAYDQRIAAYLGGPADPSVLPHHQDIPADAIREAEAMPMAPAHPDGLTQELEAIIIEAPEEISPESLLDPEFLEEIGAAVEAETRRTALERPPTPISSLVDDLGLSRGATAARGRRGAKPIPENDDFLSVLDAELAPQLDEADTQRPAPAAANEDQITIRPPPRGQNPAGRARRAASEQDAAVTRKPQRRELPPPSDTLVDFGLPAALRATLERPGRKRNDAPAPPPPSPRRPNDDLLDQELANVAASLRPVTGQPRSNDQTMLEVDSVALERQIAEQRARLKKKNAAERVAKAGKPPEDKDIVVVERSLDEVILSYLADDQE